MINNGFLLDRFWCGLRQLGKRANRQALIPLTLARTEVPGCVGLRPFLPGAESAPGRPAETVPPDRDPL